MANQPILDSEFKLAKKEGQKDDYEKDDLRQDEVRQPGFESNIHWPSSTEPKAKESLDFKAQQLAKEGLNPERKEQEQSQFQQ